jgi:Protein of unknown function (DUF3325)
LTDSTARARGTGATARAQSARAVMVLRVLGAAGVGGSLLLCLRADHASMAALVWGLLLKAAKAASMAVAVMLTWRPRWLRPLAACTRLDRAADAATSRR